MGNVNVTPNMNLPNPVPGVDSGPDYASNLQSSLNQIDQHNHSSGQGVQIQPNGLNISSDLSFSGNNGIGLNSVRFVSLSSPLTNVSPNIGCLYVSGNELYFNDYNGGNQIQLTLNGTVNATSSGIASGTATAAFSAGTLVVKSSSTSFANIDMQSAILANSGNLSNQLTLQAPTLSSSYNLTLPIVPAALSVLTVDTSGNFGFSQSAASADPVGQAMSATGANAVAATRTRSSGSSTAPIGGIAISGTCGTFSTTSSTAVPATNLAVTITTSGRPIMLLIQGDTDNDASLGLSTSVSINSAIARFSFTNGSTIIGGYHFQTDNAAGGFNVGIPASLSLVYPAVAGTYTFRFYVQAATSNTTANLFDVVLVAYEL